MQLLSLKVALPWSKSGLSSGTRQRGLKGGGSFMQMHSAGVVRARGGMIKMARRNRHAADTPSIDRLL